MVLSEMLAVVVVRSRTFDMRRLSRAMRPKFHIDKQVPIAGGRGQAGMHWDLGTVGRPPPQAEVAHTLLLSTKAHHHIHPRSDLLHYPKTFLSHLIGFRFSRSSPGLILLVLCP